MLFDKDKKCICTVFASINILIIELQCFSNVRFLLKIKNMIVFLTLLTKMKETLISIKQKLCNKSLKILINAYAKGKGK